jgi:hypothetical protein
MSDGAEDHKSTFNGIGNFETKIAQVSTLFGLGPNNKGPKLRLITKEVKFKVALGSYHLSLPFHSTSWSSWPIATILGDKCSDP